MTERNTANDGLTLEERIEALVKAGVRLELENQALEAEINLLLRAKSESSGSSFADLKRLSDYRIAKALSSPPDVGRL